MPSIASVKCPRGFTFPVVPNWHFTICPLSFALRPTSARCLALVPSSFLPPHELRGGFRHKGGGKEGEEREEKEEILMLTIPSVTSKFHPCCTVFLILSFSETRHERGPPAKEGFNHNKISLVLSKNLAQPIVAATPLSLSQFLVFSNHPLPLVG